MEPPAKQTHSYQVIVNDNFHYMDESERYRLAVFDSCPEAIAICKRLVDEYLLSAYKPGMTAAQLWTSYSTFGEDPYIFTTGEQCPFSAWDYARQRCEELCHPRRDQSN